MPIDWSKAAWLTASGARSHEIIAAVGCSRSQLRRRQQQCPLFRTLVDRYLADLEQQSRKAEIAAGERPLEEAVRRKLVEEIGEGNVRVALWLADRLRLFAPEPGEANDETLKQVLDSMTPEERAAFTRPD